VILLLSGTAGFISSEFRPATVIRRQRPCRYYYQ